MQLLNNTFSTKRFPLFISRYPLIVLLVLGAGGTLSYSVEQNNLQLAMVAGTAPVQIKVYQQSQIQNETILLKDVAQIAARSPELEIRLEQVSLGKLQQLNKPLKLYPDWIRTRLRLAGFDVEQIELECPRDAKVERAGTEIPADEVQLAVEMFIQHRLNVPEDSLELKDFMVRGANEQIPVGRRQYEIRAELDAASLGRVPFTVDVTVENRVVKQLKGSVNADVRVNVIKTAAGLPRDTVIQPEHLQIVQTNLSSIPRNVVLSPNQIVGMIANRQLNPGAFIKASDLKTLELVQRNQPVFIMLEKGPMKITARGVALQGGGMGELVQVRNSSSNKVVNGKITGQQMVQVEY